MTYARAIHLRSGIKVLFAMACVLGLASGAAASKLGYSVNISKKTLENENYREVLFTGPRIQLVVMSLEPGQEIGMETHEDGDQFIRVEAGRGRAVLDDQRIDLQAGSAVVIPAGVAHNIINTSKAARLRIYVIYSPPEHDEGVVHRTKGDEENH